MIRRSTVTVLEFVVNHHKLAPPLMLLLGHARMHPLLTTTTAFADEQSPLTRRKKSRYT